MTALEAGRTFLCTAILLVGCNGREAAPVGAADAGASILPTETGWSAQPLPEGRDGRGLPVGLRLVALQAAVAVALEGDLVPGSVDDLDGP